MKQYGFDHSGLSFMRSQRLSGECTGEPMLDASSESADMAIGEHKGQGAAVEGM